MSVFVSALENHRGCKENDSADKAAACGDSQRAPHAEMGNAVAGEHAERAADYSGREEFGRKGLKSAFLMRRPRTAVLPAVRRCEEEHERDDEVNAWQEGPKRIGSKKCERPEQGDAHDRAAYGGKRYLAVSLVAVYASLQRSYQGKEQRLPQPPKRPRRSLHEKGSLQVECRCRHGGKEWDGQRRRKGDSSPLAFRGSTEFHADGYKVSAGEYEQTAESG